MEVYAGFLEHTDHHIGRLVDALEDLGILEDTLDLLHQRRQRRERRRHPERLLQRAGRPQRGLRARDDGVHGLEDRRVRHSDGVQPLRGRLGARDGHAVPVDEAGRLPLGRDAQRHDRPLAEGHRGQGRGPQPVPSRDRRRPDGARRGGPSRAEDGPRRPAEADRGREHALRVRRRGRGGTARDAVLRDVLQPRDLRQGLDRGHPPLDPLGASEELPPFAGRHLGALRHQHRLEPGARPRGRDAREARGAEGALHGGGAEVQRAAAGRPARRALQLRPRRASDADHGQLAAPVRRHGPAERELGRSTSRTSRTP